MKSLVQSNIVLLLRDMVESINDKYLFIPDKSNLDCSPFLYEITLYKEKFEIETIDLITVGKTVVIREYDKTTFLSEVQKYVVNGYELDLNSVYWDIAGIKMVTLVNHNHVDVPSYTNKQLEDLEWEELKAVGRMYFVKGRDRQALVHNILKAQEQRNKNV